MQKQLNTQFSLQYQSFLTIHAAVLIPENGALACYREFMDKLNYMNLLESYSAIGRKPSLNPISILKILVYSYMNNIRSSRKSEVSPNDWDSLRFFLFFLF